MKILYVAEPLNGCYLYRVEVPKRVLSMAGTQIRVSHHKVKTDDADWADVVVFQKCWQIGLYEAAVELKRRGKKIIFEIDDDVFHIPFWNPAYKHYQQHKQVVKEFAVLADGITVTTEPLAAVFRAYNKRVRVLPNCLDLVEVEAAKKDSKLVLQPFDGGFAPLTPEQYYDRLTGKLVIGWFGSPTHRGDLDMILAPLTAFVKNTPDVVLVMVAAATKSLLHRVPKDKLVLVRPVSMLDWNRLLAQLRWDVALAPVEDIAFNRSKSHLKAIEAMAYDMVPVVSDTVTYNGTVTPETGFLCRTDADWTRALTRLTNRVVLDRHKHKAREHVRNWDIRLWADKWSAFYEEVLYG